MNVLLRYALPAALGLPSGLVEAVSGRQLLNPDSTMDFNLIVASFARARKLSRLCLSHPPELVFN